MGIARELIVSTFGKEDCACNICTQLVENLIVLKCEHFYCKTCIDKKIKEAQESDKKVECPECKQKFNPSADMKPPNLFMRNAMSKIKLKCSLSGCAQIVTYDNFRTHIAECSFNPDMEVKCKQCNKLYKKRKEQGHTLSCIPLMKQMVNGHFANHSPISQDWEHNSHYLTVMLFLCRISENEVKSA